jgi:hypothetical protein
MPADTKPPPEAGRKKAQPWLRAFGLAEAGSAYESVMRIQQAELDAARVAAASITEAQVAAERLSGPNVLASALESVLPTARLAEQITAVSNAHVGGLSKRLAEQLTSIYATDVKAWDGAGVAPGIGESIKASAAIAAWTEPKLPLPAEIEAVEAMSKKLAKQLDEMGSVVAGKAWEGNLPIGLVDIGHSEALKAAETLAADAERMAALAAEAMGPTLTHLDHMGAMEARAAEQYLRTPLAAKGLFTSDRLESILGESSILATTKFAEEALAPLARQIAALGEVTLPRIALPGDVAEILERESALDTTIERFAKRWESTALWFLLSILGVGQLASLAHMEREEIEAVLLDALETVVTAGIFTAALDAAVRKADYISSDQRDDLLHGLQHAQRGEFVHAVPSLMTGFEGALWSTARALTIVDAERRHLAGKPQARGVVRIEPVVRKLPAKQDYRTFVCRQVFGDTGNPVRHGEQSDRRRQALFSIAAIAGWLDAFTQVSAHDALGRMLSDALGSRRV